MAACTSSCSLARAAPTRAAPARRAVSVRCEAVSQTVAAQRQTRRALLASVVAVPLLAARAARAEEGGEVKDTDIRALMLSTVLMGVAGFTAVGAASTPMGDEGHEHH